MIHQQTLLPHPYGAGSGSTPTGGSVPPGGTSGQVLAKNSPTNYDTVWADPANGIANPAPLSGGIRKTTSQTLGTLNATWQTISNYQSNVFTTPIAVTSNLANGSLAPGLAVAATMIVNLEATLTADNNTGRVIDLRLWNTTDNVQVGTQTVQIFVGAYQAGFYVSISFPAQIDASAVGKTVVVQVNSTSTISNVVVTSAAFVMQATSGGSVTSVNGNTGVVVLNAASVGAAPIAQAVPTGGLATQVLTKNSSTNNDVSWTTPVNAVTSVNGQTGAVQVGYRNLPPNSKASGYAAIASDVGKLIISSGGGVGFGPGIFAAGDAVTVANYSGINNQIVQYSGLSIIRVNGVVGTVNIAPYALVTLVFVDPTAAFITGSGML